MKRKTRQQDRHEEEEQFKVGQKKDYEFRKVVMIERHDSDLLQRQLLTLRIADLHSILQSFAFARNARKDELQKKVLELLNSRQTSLAQKANIRSQVDQSYSKIISIKNRSRSKSPEMYAQQYSSNPLVNTTLRTPTKNSLFNQFEFF